MHPISESTMVHETLVDARPTELDDSSIDQQLIEQAGAKKSFVRRLVGALMLVAVVIGGGVFGMYKMRVDVPGLNTTQIYAHLDSLAVHLEQIKGRSAGQYESSSHENEGEGHHEEQKITVTTPIARDVTLTQQYVCQIHSRRHIEVCALEDGYLKAIPIKEGQAVKEGDVLFEVVPVLYKAKLDAEVAERDLAQLELNYTTTLAGKNGVSQKEVKLYGAKLAKAQAKVDLAEAELNFAKVTARFDGIVDRLHVFQGSLVREGDVLTTLSDNSEMWVYFNVPEKQYLEYMSSSKQVKQDQKVELKLANQEKFPEPCIRLTIEAQFNNETGNIPFRADFKNPDGLLRHGQTGTILIHRTLRDAVVIPQRATFELLDKRYVWVVGEDHVAHQTLITIKNELEDIFVVDTGLKVGDKIVLEGVRQVEEGGKVEYEFRKPEEALKNQKNHAE
jgi:membrane fusion protein (multidrug efflux system)